MHSGVDVAIVGGGVMGCGLAWRLAERGLRVAVIERGRPAAEASSAAAGILAAQAEVEGPGPLLDLALASRGLFPRWRDELFEETGLDIGYRANGVLMLASPHAEEKAAALAPHALRQRHTWQAERGLNVEWLDRAALRELEPSLGPCAGALRFADDGQVEPRRLCAALVQAATRRGAAFVHATVERLEQTAGRVTGLALTPHSADVRPALAADRVILCAGSWSSAISGSPLYDGSVQPVHGQIVELFDAPGMLRHIVFGQCSPFSGAKSEAAGAEAGGLHGYLVPRGDGRILVGATMEPIGFEKRVTAAGVRDLLGLGTSLLPSLEGARFREAWSGLRPASADGLPILGATSVAGLYACTGHFRNGILLAPISCEALCALLTGGFPPSLPPVDLMPFSPSRLDKKKP